LFSNMFCLGSKGKDKGKGEDKAMPATGLGRP
jgi:hypothetical protein